MTHLLLIEPRDPLLFRDGKPFSAGLSASSLPFPTPATTAGMMRTILGAPSNYSNLDELNSIAQIGPFLVCASDDGANWQYVLSQPADAVAYEQENLDVNSHLDLVPLRPQALEEGDGISGDIPAPQFLFGARESKPSKRLPQFWTWPSYERWLLNQQDCLSVLPGETGPPPMKRQRRMHVSISAATQTAGTGLLFTTDSLEFLASEPEHPGSRQRRITRFALVCQFEAPESLAEVPLPQLGTLGGERRIVVLNQTSAPPLPSCPAAVRNSSRVRLVLATPGLFVEGWRPEWLTQEGGSPPGHPEITLKLVAAAVPRPVPVSGWDLVKRQPKPSRLLAPAGSTYFCEVQGDASALWLKSICDDQAARDGFGIVTLGVW